MALIEQLLDYTHPDSTLAGLYRQSQVDRGTIASFDFVDPYTFGGTRPASLTGGTVLKGMDPSDRTGAVGTPSIDLGGTGLTFTNSGSRVFNLPAATKLPATATRFGFGGWIKHIDNAAGTAATLAVAGYNIINGVAANTQWLLQCARAATAGANVNYNASVGGSYSGAVIMAPNEVAHMFFVATIANGSCSMASYKNGALLNTTNPFALPSGGLPTPAGNPIIGRVPGIAEFFGQVGSFDFQDFSASGSATPAEFVARAYGDNVGRFV